MIKKYNVKHNSKCRKENFGKAVTLSPSYSLTFDKLVQNNMISYCVGNNYELFPTVFHLNTVTNFQLFELGSIWINLNKIFGKMTLSKR